MTLTFIVLMNRNLSHNQLRGSIPSCIGELTNLQNLSLNNNQLTGPIPSSIGELKNLQCLNLQDNQLTGEIPPEVLRLTCCADIGYNYLIHSEKIPLHWMQSKAFYFRPSKKMSPFLKDLDRDSNSLGSDDGFAIS